ncbi:short-chain dehydrogenase/reductase [Lactobacillus paracollinoides] [Lactiplantibacillus mudanjiangensis]|uniref:SDR family NAD(P)-dependent oxidoreductase n=1 Tax=Lactiplantibacillus mudanjiangensis TaxID=1296538 RepID=UPI001014A7A8|nr:short-chain dehydrogenase/reductase [Lactobacillus paracollinoides] [Lactiplantibacillus mudanjiangensis]
MQITIFGETGSVGDYLIDEALRQGHTVVPVSRHQHTADTRIAVKWQTVDYDDIASLAKTMAGSDAAVISLGDYSVVKPTEHILIAMKQVGVTRVEIITGFGTSPASRQQLSLGMRAVILGKHPTHKQLETNLFGATELTKLVLPTMRRQRSGRIVNISSIGGDMYSSLGGWYHIAKHGLNVWSDVLDTEIRQFGLRSVIVEPGGTASSWSEIAMGSIKNNLSPNTPYQTLVDGTLKMITNVGSHSSATSEDLAKVFYRAATDQRAKRRYYYNFSDRMMARMVRVHPEIFHQVVMRMSARAIR